MNSAYSTVDTVSVSNNFATTIEDASPFTGKLIEYNKNSEEVDDKELGAVEVI